MTGTARSIWKLLAVAVLLLAACGPAAEATPTTAIQPPTAAPTAVARATPTVGASSAAAATATATPRPGATATPQAGPKSGGVLHTLFRNDPEDWDPHKALGGANPLRQSTAAVFSPLFTPEYPDPGDCKRPIVSQLADSWKWVNDRTMEIKVRQGVKFHNKPPVNGREVTTQDVAYSLQRLQKEATYIRGLVDHIADVQALDATTVRVTTKDPFPGLKSGILDNYYGAEATLPKESGGSAELWRDPAKTWIGSGPFLFDRWQPGVKTTMVRNPDYFKKGLPRIDGVEFLVMPDLGTRISAMRSGKLDAIHELPTIGADEIKRTLASSQVYACAGSGALMWLHMRTDKAPWNDVRVRRAVAMAIDQQAMITSVLQGKAVWSGVVPPSHPFALRKEDYPADVRQYLEYNPEAAKKLLAEAGFPNGLKVKMNDPRYWGSPWNELMELSMDQLSKVGIQVQPAWEERGVYAGGTQLGKYDDITWRKLAEFDVYTDLVRFSSKASTIENRGFVNDPEMDKLLNQLMMALDENQQKELVKQIQIREVSQAYIVMAPASQVFVAYSSQVQGVGGTTASNPMQHQRLYEKVWLQ